jgi:hypothetical protein
MTDAAVAATAKLDFGRVIQGTFGAIKRNFTTFLVVVLLLVGAPGLLLIVGAVMAGGGAVAAGGGLIGLGVLLLSVSSIMLQGALVHATVADLNGRHATVGECVSTGLRTFLPVFAILILFTLGVGLSALAFIFPAFMVAVAWSVSVPAQIVERSGVFGSFTRSGQLTKNNRWRIFGLVLLWWIISTAVQGTLTNLAGVTPMAQLSAGGPASPLTMFGPGYWATVVFVGVFNAMVSGAGIAVIYYELRRVKEGVGPEALAAVFD